MRPLVSPLGSLRAAGSELDRLLGAARRAEVLQEILRRMRQEASARRGLQVALRTLAVAMDVDGAVLLDGSDSPERMGVESAAVKKALDLLAMQDISGDCVEGQAEDGHCVLLSRLPTRFGGAAGLAVWRREPPVWQQSDRQLVDSAAAVLALVLEHQAVERELAYQSRTDPLTGLLNRRGFLEELPRHIDRLEREQFSGTLMLVDLDGLRAVNERLGLLAGDRVLVVLGKILRVAVRPTDLIARLGADDFALWLNGADHMTAAERAEEWRKSVPGRLADVIGVAIPRLTLSIGIAARAPGSDAAPEDVIGQAELALAQVKREARGNWRVARADTA
jgi:diguanylate cyclase (GGDEF)-like protein